MALWGLGRGLRHILRTVLLCVRWFVGYCSWSVSHRLLDDMSQFVREQPAALRGSGIEAPKAENDVVSNCVGMSVERPSRHLCVLIRMHAHTAEVVSEARLHKGASRQVEGLTRRAKYFVDDRRHFGLSPVA